MNISKNKSSAIFLSTIILSFLFLTFSVHADSRGITVKAKTSSGTIEEIQLYSGYYALVVGISDYDSWPDLPNAVKDAHDISQALKKKGFKVKTVNNPNSYELQKALNDLTYKDGRDLNRALLFYYAGHGETEKLADGTKLGYIIPTDCPLIKDDPIGFVNKAISMKDIEAYSLRIRSKHVLMLFDSCFSGSLFSLVRAVPEDITEKSTLPVRQYVTAGSEDETVPDRSMFKRCLMIALDGDADLTRDGYITGTELGLYLHDKVVQNTRRAQHPQYGKIRTPELARGDFIFSLAGSGAVVDQSGPVALKAYLSVESNVPGARVMIDGQDVGTTNLSNIEVSYGEHQIVVKKDGYEPYKRSIQFEKGRILDLHVILDPKAPLTSRLYVKTRPEGAKIRILNIGPAFHQGIELDPGSYNVEVSAKGYETQKMQVSLAAGQDRTLDIRLDKTGRGWLGVSIQDISDEVAEHIGIEEKKGVLVAELFPDGPADLAGIKPKDIILSINGKAVNSARQLVGIIANARIGDTIAIKINRNGRIRTMDVKLAKREDTKISSRIIQAKLGIQASEITPEIVRRFRLNPKYAKGVIVIGVTSKSKAAAAGLLVRDVIMEINRKKISSLNDFIKTINEISGGETINLYIYRDRGFVAVKMIK